MMMRRNDVDAGRLDSLVNDMYFRIYIAFLSSKTA